ncbi:MAG: hypothetical protein JW730_13060 [Anaerolineales bacterium]|nr:hypothetical protein [Anaerolineales bacterium]
MASFEPLPKSLKPFFWDYPFSKLSLNTDRDLIIRRVLSSGSWDAVCWVRKEIGDENLKKWLIAHKGRGLSPRQLRFWELILDLPKRQVNTWVRVARETPWGKR